MWANYGAVLGNPSFMVPYLIFGAICVGLANARRSSWTVAAFFLTLILFVGFRFETGFDWAIYKRIYSALVDNNTVEQVLACRQVFAQEIVFIGTLGAFAKTGLDYEIMQAIFSLLLFSSIYALARVFGANPLAVIVVSLTFLAPSIVFSTLRQSIALSFFCLGIVFFIRRNSYIAVGLALLASVAFHVSAAIYVAAFILAIASRSIQMKPWHFLVLSLAALGCFAGAMFVAELNITRLPLKLAYYVQQWRPTIWQDLMIVMSLGIGLHAASSSPRNADISFLRKLIIVLAIFAVGGGAFSIINERAMYALWLFYSLFVCLMTSRFRREIIIGTATLGTLLTLMIIARYPNSLVYYPYQNYLIVKAFGRDALLIGRSEVFINEYEKARSKLIAVSKSGSQITAERPEADAAAGPVHEPNATANRSADPENQAGTRSRSSAVNDPRC